MALVASASDLLLRLVTAVVILLIGLIVGKVLGRLAEVGLHGLGIEWLLRRRGVHFFLEPFIARGIEYIVYAATVLIAITQLGLSQVVLYSILAVVLFAVLVSVLLALRDVVPNLLAGISLLWRARLKPGQRVRVDSLEGVVEHVDIFQARLRTDSGDVALVPNALFARAILVVKRR